MTDRARKIAEKIMLITLGSKHIDWNAYGKKNMALVAAALNAFADERLEKAVDIAVTYLANAGMRTKSLADAIRALKSRPEVKR